MLLEITDNNANSVIGDFYLPTCGKIHIKERKMIRSHFKIKENLIVRIFVRLVGWESVIKHQLKQNINHTIIRIMTINTTITMMIDPNSYYFYSIFYFER